MKITHVLPALTKGGGERVAADLANQAALDGHEVTVIAAYPVDSAQLRDFLCPEVRVDYISDTVVPKSRVYFSIVPWLLKHRSWLSGQDVIHCHLTYGSAFGFIAHFFRSVFRAPRPAVVGTYHSVGMAIPSMLRWAHARMAARFDALALMAEDDYWRKFITRRSKLPSAVIPNGISFKGLSCVDSAAKLAYRRQIGIPEECRYVVGTVGMLRPDRKPWLYIPIFAQIAKVFGNQVHFVMAGGGSEREHICSLIAEYGLEKQVHLTGLAIEPRLPISIMDLYITLNVGQVTGIAALEAAYLGQPVLAIQMCSKYKAKSDDWIWSGTDLDEVAARAIALLGNTSERQALATRQAAHVRSHHTAEAMARSYYSLYRTSIENLLSGGNNLCAV